MSKNINRNKPAAPKTFSDYSQCLMAKSIEDLIERSATPTPYENKNAGRDAFIVKCLVAAKGNPEDAAAAIKADMETAKLPQLSVIPVVEALCYQILKGTMFPAMVDKGQATRWGDGILKDDAFERLLDKQSVGESFEDVSPNETDARRRARLSGMSVHDGGAPLGLDPDSPEYKLYSGYQVDVPVGGDFGDHFSPSEVINGLEEIHARLELIRAKYDCRSARAKQEFPPEPLAYFVEQDATNGAWIRHNGTASVALGYYALRNEEKQVASKKASKEFFAGQAKAA